MEIVHIDQLVHPDYHMVQDHEVFGETESDNALRPLWDWRVNKVVQDKKHGLLYLSGYPIELEGLTQFPADLIEEELRRRRVYASLLEERFILFGWGEQSMGQNLLSECERYGWQMDTATLTLESYGEYLELCVAVSAQYARRTLKVKWENFKLRSELSFSANNLK